MRKANGRDLHESTGDLQGLQNGAESGWVVWKSGYCKAGQHLRSHRVQSPHFADEKTEAQRVALTGSGSHSWRGKWRPLVNAIVRAFTFPYLKKNCLGVEGPQRDSVNLFHSLLPRAPVSQGGHLRPGRKHN